MRFFTRLISGFALGIFTICGRGAASAQGDYPPIAVMSYNVENLFSPWVDSVNPDESFTPSGERHWTVKRLNTKAQRIADGIASASAGRPPAIVGLCEVEDRTVLRWLTGRTYLKPINYWIYHRDSPDPRGIDVAVLYDTAQLSGLGCRWIRPQMEDSAAWRSREILYARFRLPNGDTLHLFQNHWPSKYSGALVSVAKREAAMRGLMGVVDSIVVANPTAKIIAMGDFNEDAGDALFDAMASPNVKEAARRGVLVNMLHPAQPHKGARGSYKYQGVWAMIDNFFVSPSLLDGEGYRIESVEVLPSEFLLERDASHGGVRPCRSYLGPRFNSLGTSDHLPIVLRLKFANFAPWKKAKRGQKE